MPRCRLVQVKEEGVQEMLAKITAVKSQIASNDGQIALLLRNVTTGSG